MIKKNNCFSLYNQQHLFLKNNMDILRKLNLMLKIHWPLVQKFLKSQSDKSTYQYWTNRSIPKHVWSQKNKWQIWLNHAKLKPQIHLILRFWKGYFMECFCNFSGANLQLSAQTMQHSSSELQAAVTSLNQLFSNNLPPKIQHWNFLNMKKSYICNIIFPL